LHSGKSLLILPTFENRLPVACYWLQVFKKFNTVFINEKVPGSTGNQKPVTGNQYQAT